MKYLRLFTIIFAFLLTNNLFSQSSEKEKHSFFFSFGLHKNFFLDNKYSSADTSDFSYHEIINIGYKSENELSVNFGINYKYNLLDFLSIRTGILFWNHNNILRSQKDTLIKYYSYWEANPPLFKRENSNNIEIPIFICLQKGKFACEFGFNINVFTFQKNYYEFINNKIKRTTDIYFFEIDKCNVYNNIPVNFLNWQLYVKYHIQSLLSVKIGANSLNELIFGFDFQL